MNTIGFAVQIDPKNEPVNTAEPSQVTPRRSVVQVQFESSSHAYSYYNDRFDLQLGDTVYVEGAFEEERGRVIDISYHFKIDLKHYKRVIGVADTRVCGELFFAQSRMMAFERDVIPYEKILSWFVPPKTGESEIVVSTDDPPFLLENPTAFQVTPVIAERGKKYFMNDKVVYLSLDGEQGRAIVNGTKPYEVEFTYRSGEVSDLLCDCFCTYHCKHEVAVLLQLREVLDVIKKQYADRFGQSGYFASICKADFYAFAAMNRDGGTITFR